jgi:hypothetical protein
VLHPATSDVTVFEIHRGRLMPKINDEEAIGLRIEFIGHRVCRLLAVGYGFAFVTWHLAG